MPIQIVRTDNFKDDIKELLAFVFQRALDNSEPPQEAEDKFRDNLQTELKKKVSQIHGLPFSYEAYDKKKNPVRKCPLMNGDLVLEYLIGPTTAEERIQVESIYLTAILPTRSGKYAGAYNTIPTVSIDELIEKYDI